MLYNGSLNEGGVVYVKKHPNLLVRVVHGNTLTATVILMKSPKIVTHFLGRAISLYLCRKKICVLVRPTP